MKKILIIGANGFTGRQILNDLSVHAQYKVTGCSLHPDISPNDVGKYRFIETDIRNEADIKCLFEEVQPDVVINCSALSVPDYCETHHEEAYLTNANWLFFAKNIKAGSFIYRRTLFSMERCLFSMKR